MLWPGGPGKFRRQYRSLVRRIYKGFKEWCLTGESNPFLERLDRALVLEAEMEEMQERRPEEDWSVPSVWDIIPRDEWSERIW